MSTALESLFNADDLKALESMAKPVDETPAVPVADAVVTPPAVETPATPAVVTPPAADPVTLEDLAVLQAQTIENVGKLAEAMMKRDVAAGVVDKPTTPDARQLLFEKVVGENPELGDLVKQVFELQDRQKALETSTQSLAGDKALEEATATQLAAYESQASEMVATFPGLTEGDLKSCFDWIADPKNTEQARLMSVRMVAEKVHGYAYLDARRTPPGVVRDGKTPSPPPATPPAVLVTTSAPGSPGAAPATPAPEPGGDLRTTFASILSDPTSRAKLGKYGP
jgi:hypothetical protein